MKQHQFPVRFGSITVTVNMLGLLQKIEWHWTPCVGSQLTLAPPSVLWLFRALQAYFDSGVPLGEIPWNWIDDSFWTSFQRQVYLVISRLPHGETRTYGWVAQRLGQPSASRAVGQALRANPLPVLVPCHRIVSVASLGGFMGSIDPNCSEMRLKQRLISLEEEYINPLFDFLTPSRELYEAIA
ncbi:MGMT family protein [Bdellovibrionota bacterium FG-1]